MSDEAKKKVKIVRKEVVDAEPEAQEELKNVEASGPQEEEEMPDFDMDENEVSKEEKLESKTDLAKIQKATPKVKKETPKKTVNKITKEEAVVPAFSGPSLADASVSDLINALYAKIKDERQILILDAVKADYISLKYKGYTDEQKEELQRKISEKFMASSLEGKVKVIGRLS